MNRRVKYLLCVSIVLFVIHPTTARSYCTWTPHPQFVGRTHIPVYIRDGTWNDFMHPNGVTWSRIQLELEVEWALNEINNTTSAAHPPLSYAGLVTCSDTNMNGLFEECQTPNAMVITSTGPGYTACDAQWIPAERIVSIPRHNCNPPLPDANARFSQWLVPGTRTDHLVAMLLHELGHGLGLGDFWNCTTSTNPACTDPLWPNSCSMMQAPWLADLHHSYYLDDALGLRAIWGTAPAIGRGHYESLDLVSWSTIGTSTPGTDALRWGSGASTNWSATHMFLVYRDDATLKPFASSWNWSTTAWTPYFQPSLYAEMGTVGAAREATHSSALYLIGETQTNVRTWIASSRHANSSGAASSAREAVSASTAAATSDERVGKVRATTTSRASGSSRPTASASTCRWSTGWRCRRYDQPPRM